MFHLDNNSGVSAMPAPAAMQNQTTRWFTEGGGNQSPSWPGQDWFNIVQAELLAILTAAGITPDKKKINQLALAIKTIANKDALLKDNCLSEFKTAGAKAQAASRVNLGLGDCATLNVGTTEGTVAAGDDSRIVKALQKDKNLSDLTDVNKAKETLALDKVGNWPAVQANGGLHSSGNHRIYIDWGEDGKLHVTVDTSDEGELFTTANPPTPAQSNSYPMWGGNLNENASITVISSVLQGNVGDFLYGPMFRTTLKARGGDQDFKDGASFFMRIVEHVGTLAYGELVFDGFSSVQSFVFDQNGNFHAAGNVQAGGAWLATDGNVYGSVWGGYLSDWIAGQIDARIGNNNNWINQSFISGQRQASAQWAAERVGGGAGLQVPAGCVMIGARNNGSSDVANMGILYAAEQICINGNWMTIGLV